MRSSLGIRAVCRSLEVRSSGGVTTGEVAWGRSKSRLTRRDQCRARVESVPRLSSQPGSGAFT